MQYPVAWIAQHFRQKAWDEWETWDGESELAASFVGTGPMPTFLPAIAHIDYGDRIGEEGDWQAIDEAIAWAHARVPRVLIRVGYSDCYSAGREPVAGYSTWPPTEEAIRSETLRGDETSSGNG